MRNTWRMLLSSVAVMCWLIAIAGCSGSGGSSGSGVPATGTTSVTGVVSDGYLQGAKVFIDTKGNKKWDSSMPYATTDATGKYVMSNVSSARLAKYPVVVEVPAGAVDADRGTVTQPYVLQAPAGKPDFVSPLTTMVQHEVETKGVTADQAEAKVKQNLGLSATTSLFKDFKANQTTAVNDEYKHAANVAMVVATAIAQNKAVIDAKVATLGLTGDQTAAVTKLILDTISQQVGTIVQQVLANVNTATGKLDPNIVTTLVTNSNVTVSTADTTALKQQLVMQNATTVPVSFKDAISGTGLFNIDSWQNWVNGQPTMAYEYQKILLGPQATDGTYPLSEAMFRYSNSAWTAYTGTDTKYYLTSTGWQLASDDAGQGAVTVNTDGSITWKHKIINYSMNVAAIMKNMSGVAIQPLVAPNGITVNSAAVFPGKSQAYKMSFTPLQTTYRLWPNANVQVSTGTSITKNATSLADIINASVWFSVGSNSMSVKFTGTGTTTGSTGTLSFYPIVPGAMGPTLSTTALPDTGTWTIQEPVAGYQVIVVNLPISMQQYMDSYQKTPILGVVSGAVLYGGLEYQGVTKQDRGFNYNKTAFDSILANFMAVNAPAPTQMVSKVSIEGYVRNASGIAVAGAVVGTSLDTVTTTTDANGHFFLQTNTAANYSSTPYTITITKTGYTTFSQPWNWGDHPMGQLFKLQ
ncbi:carboxypeptidase-like regulatory domain-containing protein [Geobacter argillaceus]|uniref:Carboxypeptidase family protein n=1 Tax=Geobacter argillaceus TaxID=345631 RepID=A0A562V7K1_9BACT|nr:carboxypeptidase-like regulatory domain-containing protein [Geobacter argillaceus]TWJ13875.1 carboxypeptidase family protein [Geobacter argillaceus]